jgi:hypothetical protein
MRCGTQGEQTRWRARNCPGRSAECSNAAYWLAANIDRPSLGGQAGVGIVLNAEGGEPIRPKTIDLVGLAPDHVTRLR